MNLDQTMRSAKDTFKSDIDSGFEASLMEFKELKKKIEIKLFFKFFIF